MRKEDTIFYIISLLVLIILIFAYVDYKPKSKFSVFVVRKMEALKHFIFRNEEEKQKKIKKLEEDIATYKKEFADLKNNWREETDNLDILVQSENEMNENLQNLNVSLNDYFLEAENIYLYFKNERVPDIKSSSEKIIFFEDFSSLIKSDIEKEKSDLEEKLRSYEQKMEDTKFEMEKITNRLQNTVDATDADMEERREELRIKEREHREAVRKIKDVKSDLSAYDDKNTKIQRFEKIVSLMRNIFEKIEDVKMSLKKLSLNIKDKKRALENSEEKLKELSENIARDEEYLQELRDS